jgi:hypothetical protein
MGLFMDNWKGGRAFVLLEKVDDGIVQPCPTLDDASVATNRSHEACDSWQR